MKTTVLLVFLLSSISLSAQELPDKPQPRLALSSFVGSTYSDFEGRELPHKKAWVILSLTTYAATMTDTGQTIYHMDHGGVEINPIARPFVEAPHPLYVASSLAEATLCNVLGSKMQRSNKKIFRKTWWLPQALQISGSAWGIATTYYNWHK